MSIYVDPMRPCMTNNNWRHKKACHLFADSDEELHSFAESIGLKRSWHQDRTSLSHYDLTEGKRKQAVGRGAQEVTMRQMVEHMRMARAGR